MFFNKEKISISQNETPFHIENNPVIFLSKTNQKKKI